MRRPWLVPLFAALAPAQERPRPYPVVPPPEWQRAVERGTRTAEGRPGPRAWQHRLGYRIEADLDPTSATVAGRAELTFGNGGPGPVPHLCVHLRQDLHRADALRNTRVAITGGMTVEEVRLDGRSLADGASRRAGTLLLVDLPEPLRPGAETTLSLRFSFTVPPAGGAPRMGHEDHRVFFLGYWYPQFAVHDDLAGWDTSPYLGESEFYMPYGDYELLFTAPQGWLVQATGALQNAHEVLAPRSLEALRRAAAEREPVAVVDAGQLAAGGATATVPSGRLCWRFAATGVRDCAVAVSDQWVWDATHAVVPGRDGPGVDGTCLVHAFYRPRARAFRHVARYAQHAIEHVSALLTPYPWPHVTAVEGVIDGGMEYPMMTLMADVRAPVVQQSLTAHELIHMWYPMQVGSNEQAHAWLDEGLTDFLTDLADADFWQRDDSRRRTLDEFRALAAMGFDREPLMRHGDHYTTPMGYQFASYVKPKAVLHQLAGLCGREAVVAALRDYARAWDRRHPTPWDFFRMMNAALGQDLDWYWRTWCYENWRLDQAIDAVRAEEGCTVVVVRDLGDAPHPTLVRACYGDERTEDRTVPVAHWLGGARTAEVRFGPDVVWVALDPERTSLDVEPDNNHWQR